MSNLWKMNFTFTSQPSSGAKKVTHIKTSKSLLSSSKYIYSNPQFSIFSNMYLENKGCGSCGRK